MREARLGEVEDVENPGVEREDEDRDLNAHEDERELAPEDAANDRAFASSLLGLTRAARLTGGAYLRH
jgi:hypothetical protein